LKIKDKKLKKMIDVSQSDCPSFACYWPRLNPGSFQAGRGYRSYDDARDKEWICGRREIHGCPDSPQKRRVNPNEEDT
jgi:hypothetical protein